MLIQQILMLGALLHVGPPLGLVSITQRRLDTRHNNYVYGGNVCAWRDIQKLAENSIAIQQ